ncbi:DinB family protein [Chitinophaga lutea]
MARPLESDYAKYYHTYISKVKEDDLHTALRNETEAMWQFLDGIPAGKHDYAYAPGKWTVKQALQHMIDAERVFAYRALRIARNDKTPLPGFDENEFAANARVDHRSWSDLVEEFRHVRNASVSLFESLDTEELDRRGTASDNPITVLSIGYILVGHVLHHIGVIRERYL